MRKLLLSIIGGCIALTAQAQQMPFFADFEGLSLSKPDTFYVNYSNPMHDVGFTALPFYFQCNYDTAFGGVWTSGFAYSNMTDSITSGYLNQYSAKTAKGHNGSNKYAVWWQGYSPISKAIPNQYVVLNHDSVSQFGFYITNSTFAYNSMRDGDFISKKFGGVSGNDTDWFKLTVRAYWNGQLKNDSVDFYLADFRFSNNQLDYIVNTWEYVDLMPLMTNGGVDSLAFELTSTDNDPQFGMNTPAYFCVDDFTARVKPTSVDKLPAAAIAKVYPNPATDKLFVELKDKGIKTATVFSMSGRAVAQYNITGDKLEINTANLPAGTYMLVLKGASEQASVRFVKQ